MAESPQRRPKRRAAHRQKVSEGKVTYRDGPAAVRVVRGIVTFDGPWIVVTRRDGVVRINSNVVIHVRTGETQQEDGRQQR